MEIINQNKIIIESNRNNLDHLLINSQFNQISTIIKFINDSEGVLMGFNFGSISPVFTNMIKNEFNVLTTNLAYSMLNFKENVNNLSSPYKESWKLLNQEEINEHRKIIEKLHARYIIDVAMKHIEKIKVHVIFYRREYTATFKEVCSTENVKRRINV